MERYESERGRLPGDDTVALWRRGPEVTLWLHPREDGGVCMDDCGCCPEVDVSSEDVHELMADWLESVGAVDERRIRALRAEAAEVGDCAQLALCDRALLEDFGADGDYSGGGLSREDWLRISAMSAAEARVECARALQAARDARGGL